MGVELGSSEPSAGSQVPPSQPAVRFASKDQEIEPSHSLQTSATMASEKSQKDTEISPEAQEEIRSISRGLHNSQLQQRRLSNFAFEPVSLPVSRVPTNESSQPQSLRDNRTTPRLSPTVSPAEDAEPRRSSSGADLTKLHPDFRPPQNGSASENGTTPSSRPSSVSGQISTRPTTRSRQSSGGDNIPKVGASSTESGNYSTRSSWEHSPSRTSASGAGTVTPPTSYNRPLTPAGDKDDPYARSRRPPQSKNLDTIDARFVFGGIDNRRRSAYVPGASSSSTAIPRSSSGSDLKSQNRPQSFFGGKKEHFGHLHDEGSSSLGGKQHGSMSELKRFFGIGGHHKDKAKRSQSPSAMAKKTANSTGTRTPPHQLPAANVPFADDHGLETKYGKFGKVLGSGAGGSVRLIKRSVDGVTFAVKQFRDRHAFESEREYSKKVTAEFCIGSTLHHGNVIETLDIVHERGHWYEIMEYAPYDLFAIVMTGKMSKEEVACSFLQIVSGVTYLHSMGLAHRDLKLDNVVVNEYGIMKLIDFGSATVFRYPFENDIVLAHGIVGSDPYLAPEVYDSPRYDPQPADIWSLAIIFACMSLRRFPWKAPRPTDNSFKLFSAPPTPGTPPADAAAARKASERRSVLGAQSTPGSLDSRGSSAVSTNQSSDAERSEHRHHHHHRNHQDHSQEIADRPSSTATPAKEVLRGPWRLLRLLPRETRNIVGLMLEIDPARRATLEDMMADPWISQTAVCSQIEGGRVIKAEGHTHTLEQGTTVSAAHSKD
ncbi:MAG: hypothetical protein Q9191_000507 [Dirinaria sp. TL-2023a]